MIQLIADVAVQLRSRVYSRFRNQPRISAYISAVGSVLQVVEADVYGTAFSMLISQATGETLNRWGELVGEQRQGLTNEEYRDVIRSKISAARSGGGAKGILNSLSAYTGDPLTEFRTSSSAWARVAYTGDLSASRQTRLVRLLSKGIAAGYGLEVIQMTTDPLRFGDSFGKAFGSQRIDS